MIKGREAKAAAASADLLVCFPKFPSRPHLTLMPKPICSPARPNNRHHRRSRSISRIGATGTQASPLLWAKTKSMGSEISEPTSPKVTCAGQIKVRPKAAAAACRSWQSVMEEIEKIHNDKKQRKRSSWAESLGFKKEVMQFLTCLRSIRFDFRCFGSFPGADVTTEDEDEEEEEEEDEEDENHAGTEEREIGQEEESSRTVFSKWFMVLQEEQSTKEEKANSVSESSPAVPPPNALLLMRCRSAPAKSWLKDSSGGGGSGGENIDDDDDEEEGSENRGKGKEKAEVKRGQSLKSLMEEEKRKKEKVVVMRYDPDLYEISTDIAKETWIVGDLMDQLSRSRSWKR